MYICTKCSHITEQKMNFCALCGAPMAEAVPVPAAAEAPQAPAAPQPPVAPQAPAAPQPPVAPATPVAPPQPLYPRTAAPAPKKSPDKLGFVFSVIGAVLALVGIYAVWSGFWSGFATDDFVDLPNNAMVSFFFCAPFSLMGFIFSSESERKDGSCTFTRVGKTLSICGLVIAVLLLILSFVSCIFVYA